MQQMIMLTKAGCTQCASAKMILEKALNNKYNPYINFVQKEQQPEQYDAMVQQYNIMALPAFITPNGTVLRNASPSALMQFLKTNIAL